MVVKLNARHNITLTVGSSDFSAEYTGAQASYSSLSLPDSGLCLMSGTITLTQTEDTGADFDSRFNPLWQRGQIVTLKEGTEFLPIIGVSYIISADYDMASKLVLNVGCLLSLHNFRTSKNSVVCANFGTNTGVGTIMRTLMASAGIPTVSVQAREFNVIDKYYRSEPLLVGDSQSLLQAAGVIAGQHGGFLVQQNNGQVKFQSVLDTEDYVHYGAADNLQSYERQGLPETVVSQIEFTYNNTSVLTGLGTASNSVRSGDTTVEVSTSRDINNKINYSTLKEYRQTSLGTLALISTSNTVSTFEAESLAEQNLNRTGQILTLAQCYPDSDYRILKKETTTTSDNTEVLKAWLATKATAAVPSGFSISGTITATKNTEQYSYSNNEIVKTSTLFQAAGIAIPLLADRTLGRSGSPTPITDINPTSLLIADQIIETWTKSYVLGQKWNYSKNTFRNRYLVKPEDLTQQVLDATVALQTISVQSQQLVPIARETQFNVDEPVTETFQQNTEIGREPKSFVIGTFTGNPFEVSELIDLGDYGNIEEETLRAYGAEILKFRNGRVYGMTVAAPVFDLKDNWPFIIPYKLTKIVEPSHLRTNIASVFRIDTPTLTLSKTEGILSYSGNFIGLSSEPANTSSYNDVLTDPVTAPSPVFTTNIVTGDITYLSEQSFSFNYIP